MFIQMESIPEDIINEFEDSFEAQNQFENEMETEE